MVQYISRFESPPWACPGDCACWVQEVDLCHGSGGANYSVHDYSDITFPYWPEGIGGCVACHDQEAAQGNVSETPTRNACGACHDAIVWATGENHDDESYGMPDDTKCADSDCHSPSDTYSVHVDPRKNSTYNPGLNLEILSISGGTSES